MNELKVILNYNSEGYMNSFTLPIEVLFHDASLQFLKKIVNKRILIKRTPFYKKKFSFNLKKGEANYEIEEQKE